MPVVAARIRGRSRVGHIREHRRERYLTFLFRLMDGDPTVTPEMVAERGEKYVEIKKSGPTMSKRLGRGKV